MKLEMQFWDQVSLLSLLMLTEYVFIKTCVLFLCFCEGAFLHAMSRDTRLSALLVSRKRKIWVATSPPDENPRGMCVHKQVADWRPLLAQTEGMYRVYCFWRTPQCAWGRVN